MKVYRPSANPDRSHSACARILFCDQDFGSWMPRRFSNEIKVMIVKREVFPGCALFDKVV
jgi:hypothetical protein